MIIDTTTYSSTSAFQTGVYTTPMLTSLTTTSTQPRMLNESYNANSCNNSQELPGANGDCKPLANITVRRIKIRLSFFSKFF